MKEIESFVKELSENVFVDTPKELLNEQTEYMELEEWTSMSAFTLISYIEESFGKKISLPELIQSQTIGDLYNVAKR